MYNAISLRTISDLPLTFSNSPREGEKEEGYLFARVANCGESGIRADVAGHVLGYKTSSDIQISLPS